MIHSPFPGIRFVKAPDRDRATDAAPVAEVVADSPAQRAGLCAV